MARRDFSKNIRADVLRFLPSLLLVYYNPSGFDLDCSHDTVVQTSRVITSQLLSTEVGSRAMSDNPFADPRLPTLADIRDRIGVAAGLSSRQQTDLCSALHTVGRVLGRRLDELPAHPTFLRPKLADVAPARHGLSPASWANTRSRLRKALEVGGCAVMPGRYLISPAPDWAGLLEQPADAHPAHRSQPLCAYCSSQGIAPAEVTEATFATFKAALEQEGLLGDPRTVHRETCRCWNLAAAQLEGWPPLRVEVPAIATPMPCPGRAFRRNVEAEVEQMVSVAIGSRPAGRHHAPADPAVSAEHRVTRPAPAGSGAVRQGVDPAACAWPARLRSSSTWSRRGCAFMLERNGAAQTTGRLHGVIKAVITVARHHVRLTDERAGAADRAAAASPSQAAGHDARPTATCCASSRMPERRRRPARPAAAGVRRARPQARAEVRSTASAPRRHWRCGC